MKKSDLLVLQYREMLRIRIVEEELAERYASQQIRCPMHLCIGQEAVPVGVCSALSRKDLVFGNHRSHGHYLAKGGSINGLVAELYGLTSGCAGGRGGSMHLIDQEAGFMGSTPIVGGTVPLAVGAAWSLKLRQQNSVCVVFFGDGCFEEGVMHESMNFAMLHHLPIIFVCENNQFSVYTKLTDRQPIRPIYKVAQAHGLEANAAAGIDVSEVYKIAKKSYKRALCGIPQFLEFHVFRWREHCGPNFDSELGYRTREEILQYESSCPLQHAEQSLLNEKILDRANLERIKSSEKRNIISVFDTVLSEEILVSTNTDKVYAG